MMPVKYGSIKTRTSSMVSGSDIVDNSVHLRTLIGNENRNVDLSILYRNLYELTSRGYADITGKITGSPRAEAQPMPYSMCRHWIYIVLWVHFMPSIQSLKSSWALGRANDPAHSEEGRAGHIKQTCGVSMRVLMSGVTDNMLRLLL